MSDDSYDDLEGQYLEAVKDYYQLKKTYDDIYKRRKKKIKRRDISLGEKKVLLGKLKMKCVSCKRSVGTLFTNANGILKAVCGDTTSPCRLHIEIKKSDWRYLPLVIEHVQKIVDKIKRQIIETKLNFLFGLEEERATVDIFERLKEDFNRAQSLLVNLEDILLSSENWVERNRMIKTIRLQLYEKNQEFRAAIDEYKKTQNATLLTDAMKIYIKQILHLEGRIQHFKYANIYIDNEDKQGDLILDQKPPDVYVLKTPNNTILQQEESWDTGNVISNLK